MEGFVIAQIDEESQEPLGFWGGTALTEALDDASFYEDKSAARAVFGDVQRLSNNQEFKLLKVRKVLEIVE